MRPDRYPAHTVPQPGVGTLNVGHGQHAGGSREAPGGNEGRCGSTLRKSNALMGGMEFNEGKKMATDGNGLDEDWTMVLEMCEQEIAGSGQLPTRGHHNQILSQWTLNAGSGQMPPLGQHYKISSQWTFKDGSGQMPPLGQHCKISSQKTFKAGSGQLPAVWQHCKIPSQWTLNDGSGQMPPRGQYCKIPSQKTVNSCMSHAPTYLRDYPKVTLLGGPLSHTRLHRGNCVPELRGGSGQMLTRERHDKILNATDFDPGDTNAGLSDSDESEVECDELARRYARHGLKEPNENFDSADEEVQLILNQGRTGHEADDVRDVGRVKLNVFESSSGSESIEILSGHEDSGSEEFLGYYKVGPDGKRRPIPAPRRLARMPAVNGTEAEASSAVTQSLSPAVQPVEPKTGKEVVFAEVRRHRISLSDDSQGRFVSLIPPEYDGQSMQSMPNTLPQQPTLPQQVMIPQLGSHMFNTLPQYQSAEEAWYRIGPKFQRGQTRFRTYGNGFDVGVVLPDYVGPRPLSAPTHNTTKTKPPDIRVDDSNAIPLRTVAFAIAGFHPFQFRKTRAGLRLEKKLGPGLVAPPRKARLLGSGTEEKGKPECTVDYSSPQAREIDSGNPESPPFTGSTEIENVSTIPFPRTGVDKVSDHPGTQYFTGSTGNKFSSPKMFPSTGTDGFSPPQESHIFIGSTKGECNSRSPFPSIELDAISPHQKSSYFTL